MTTTADTNVGVKVRQRSTGRAKSLSRIVLKFVMTGFQEQELHYYARDFETSKLKEITKGAYEEAILANSPFMQKWREKLDEEAKIWVEQNWR